MFRWVRLLLASWRRIHAKKAVERLRLLRPPEEMFLPNIASRGARYINCPRFLLVSRTHKNSIMRASGVKSHNWRNIEPMSCSQRGALVVSPSRWNIISGHGNRLFSPTNRTKSSFRDLHASFIFLSSRYFLWPVEISPCDQVSLYSARERQMSPVSCTLYHVIRHLTYRIEYERFAEFLPFSLLHLSSNLCICVTFHLTIE